MGRIHGIGRAVSTGFFADIEMLEPRLLLASARIAEIGDFGWTGPGELAVANMVKSWDTSAAPLDAILTAGDNNYQDGEWSTIDTNIGQYYSRYIGNYKGTYGPG